MCQGVTHIFSECHHIYQYEVLQRCEKYSWWSSSSCNAFDDHGMPKQKVVNRPYCRGCFSKARRKITREFMKREDAISKNGLDMGLTADQIEEIQAEWRESLRARLQQFDEESMGKTKAAVPMA